MASVPQTVASDEWRVAREDKNQTNHAVLLPSTRNSQPATHHYFDERDFCPGDRVVYADRWQGTLDSPSAEDLEWLAANPMPEPFEPTAADWDDYYEFRESEDAARMQRADDEAADRYNLHHL